MMKRQEDLRERKRRAMELMDSGVSWQEADERSGLNYSRRGIEQLYQRWREQGDEALVDDRHGHSYKATAEVQDWLSERCTEDSEVRSSQLASEIEAQFGVELHPGYITLLRHQLGLPVPRPGHPRIRQKTTSALESEPGQDFSPR
jgi:transposase